MDHQVDFTRLEDYFQWCASNDFTSIQNFKANLPRLYFKELIIPLIEQEKYIIVDKILSWCFFNDLQQINQFTSNLYKEDTTASYIKEDVILPLLHKDHSCALLDKFVSWCFKGKEKINKFKSWALYPDLDENELSVCSHLLCEQKFDLADQLISWSHIGSSKDITRFKNQLMLSKDISSIFNAYLDASEESLCALIQWLHPSIETAKKFKECMAADPHIYPRSDFIIQWIVVAFPAWGAPLLVVASHSQYQ